MSGPVDLWDDNSHLDLEVLCMWSADRRKYSHNDDSGAVV